MIHRVSSPPWGSTGRSPTLRRRRLYEAPLSGRFGRNAALSPDGKTLAVVDGGIRVGLDGTDDGELDGI